MKKILIFAGTTEGRRLSECLSEAGIVHTVCVATEYGEIVLTKNEFAEIHCGRMNEQEMREYLIAGGYGVVVDATHPYAQVVTENIKAALSGLEIPYLRVRRESSAAGQGEMVSYWKDSAACAKALEQVEGNILLTTGSKELAVFCQQPELKKRLYVRVLPGMESLKLCMDQGIAGRQILALQGPFTVEMNEAMLHQYEIRCLVTKESGTSGGYQEKLKAAERAGIPVYVIGRPKEEGGDSLGEICRKLERICGLEIPFEQRLSIVLAGIGMGAADGLTKEVERAIRHADILIGAERMIAPYQPRVEKRPYYRAEEILPYLRTLQEGRVVILFSGDSGFYSGASSLYRALRKELEAGRLHAELTIMPGISSVSYLASKVGESYQDARICSMHGKKLSNLAKRIRHSEKLFLLMSGVKDMHKLGALMQQEGLEACTVWAGYQLSYPEEKILELSPADCCELEADGLYTCLIRNPLAVPRCLTHGKPDCVFLRDKVPMTKEEVREVSICKLKLHEDAVVYDIGSGTGSIAVEMAELSDEIEVYAIEQKEAAVSLIRKNKEQFGLENIHVIEAAAPEGLEALPAPTHAFIGGSGGRMKEILTLLYQKNPRMRVVINAISMETICEIREVLAHAPICQEEVVQMQVSRSKAVGAYHLMQAENPVWICAFEFCVEEGKGRVEG